MNPLPLQEAGFLLSGGLHRSCRKGTGSRSLFPQLHATGGEKGWLEFPPREKVSQRKIMKK